MTSRRSLLTYNKILAHETHEASLTKIHFIIFVVISRFGDISKTRQTPTRDGLGGRLPDMTPLKRGRNLEATGPFSDSI